ncbi:malto-oligosyltrehalose synthase [Draconibacterium halophilum]|uniref:Malto-oligosyltrehalose synthase n=1 Tax=Draconibacterium halophilum TaxID=2706887 RepID=A0A6C0RG86_9BACT|nr:malto-oligosyltrehalose synthase [Draconibacterium halophilum]QIA09077.1 malto-oligosyltrehalose synthase [Draconibacterium halophilum]
MPIYNPVSTYRLQFNKDFTLKDAEQIIPYLHKLGIKTIYASPVFQAVRGSSHGYDVTDPLQLNPEIGTVSDLSSLIKKVGKYNMGWLQDIVPNHMAFSVENPWIYDVLEKGKNSEFYPFFDILENHPEQELKNRLMLPFFGKPLEKLIEDKELTVSIAKNGFKLNYFDNQYPVSVSAYPTILESAPQQIIPESVSACLVALAQNKDFDKVRHNLLNDYHLAKETENYINECLSAVNNNPEKMKELVSQLYYQPAFWKDTEYKINYRRFFTINGLICVNVQHKEVFSTTHKLIESWLTNKVIQGVRVDHIDGLFNPTEYLERLRNLAGEEPYIVVEKILEEDETIPDNWPVEGTSGYDFLGMVNNLLTNPDKGKDFYSYYKNWIDDNDDFSDVFYRKSRFILYNRLKGELESLTRECSKINAISSLNLDGLKVQTTIGEFLVFCPVYKLFQAPSSFSEKEKQLVSTIFTEVKKKSSASENVVNVLEDLFLLRLPGSENEIPAIDTFFRHCMQFTGPLMAKGIEDTAFYSYNPFICHNEVGDSPGYFGICTETFHNYMKERLEKLPLTMNAISTHDTKRGEDARARLNVLSDMPEKWMGVTQKWREVNREFKQFDGDNEIPSPNDEYLIYQVVCAHLPMNAKIDDTFVNRMEEYLLKAMREAKVNSSWSDPNEYYENNTVAFARKILSPESKFTAILFAFMEALIPHGITNSITQLILKNTVPGAPDTFQGTEYWNLSFVDPDNRRPVDFARLSDQLQQIIAAHNTDAKKLAEKLWKEGSNGKVKQWITWLTLQERMNHENLFLKGSYIPLKVTGEFEKNIIAFYRNFHDEHLIVMLPLNTAALPDGFSWNNTQIELPASAPSKWINRITKELVITDQELKADEIFGVVPFGILRSSV